MDKVTTSGGRAQASGVFEALQGFQGEDRFGSYCSREYLGLREQTGVAEVECTWSLLDTGGALGCAGCCPRYWV